MTDDRAHPPSAAPWGPPPVPCPPDPLVAPAVPAPPGAVAAHPVPVRRAPRPTHPLPRRPGDVEPPSPGRPAGRLRRFVKGKPSASALATLATVGVVAVGRSILMPASFGTPAPPPTLPPATTFPVVVGVVTPTVCTPVQQASADDPSGVCAYLLTTTTAPVRDDAGR